MPIERSATPNAINTHILWHMQMPVLDTDSRPVGESISSCESSLIVDEESASCIVGGSSCLKTSLTKLEGGVTSGVVGSDCCDSSLTEFEGDTSVGVGG